MAQIRVRQHDALRIARRTRRILDERHVVGAHAGNLAALAGPHVADQDAFFLEQLRDVGEVVARGELEQLVEQAALGKQRTAPELGQDPEQLEAMLVADADRDRHGHDAAEQRGPERNDELLVRFREYDQLVAGLHAARLQRPEQRRRALPELRVREGRLVVFAIDKAYRPIPVAPVDQKVDHGVVKLHEFLVD